MERSTRTGQNGFFRLERAGTFLDKLLAIEAIARRDWGLSYTVDERYYINFYDLFDDEVDRPVRRPDPAQPARRTRRASALDANGNPTCAT